MSMPPQYASPVSARRNAPVDNILTARSSPQFKVKPVTTAAAMSYSGWFSGRLTEATVGSAIPSTRRLTKSDGFLNIPPLTARRPESARSTRSFHNSIPGLEFTRPRNELLLARVQTAPTYLSSLGQSDSKVPILGFGDFSRGRKKSVRVEPFRGYRPAIPFSDIGQSVEQVPSAAGEAFHVEAKNVNYDELGETVAHKYGVVLQPYAEGEKARLKTLRDEAVKALVKEMKERFELKQPIKSKRHRYVLLAFQTGDHENTGFVTKEALRKSLKILNNDVPEPHLSYICDELPQNEKGEVSYTFLMAIVNCDWP